MKIKKISYRNFGSYGNKTLELDIPFEPGLFSVQGENGAGKSTLSDVVKFGIYGKLESKKLKDIANRLNKNAFVRIELSSRRGEIAIERGIEPGFFHLYIDGVEFDKAGKRSVQEFLEEEILEMPFYVFSNTLSISIDDFKSFLKMSTFDKKAIIDKIFGLQVLNKMRDLIKQQTKKLKDIVKGIESSIEAYQNTMTKTQNEIALLEEKLQVKSEERVTQLNEAQVVLDKNIKIGIANGSKLDSKRQEIVDSKRHVNESLSGDRALAKESMKKIELYKNSQCPVCEGNLDTDFHKTNEREYIKALEESNFRISEKEKMLTDLNGKLTQIDELRSKNQTSVQEYKFKLNRINTELGTIQEGENASDQTSSLKKMFDDLKSNVEGGREKHGKTQNAIAYFGLVEEILGEKGVKQMAIRSILPALNAEIGRLVKTMGIEHRIVFNEDFDAKITHFGIPVSSTTLSTGEMKKVDFAVLLGVIRMMKVKYPSINMIFLDELFSSIDGNGQYHILNILRQVVKDYNLNIFVISHYPLPSTEFDWLVKIHKNRGYSTFDLEKVE